MKKKTERELLKEATFHGEKNRSIEMKILLFLRIRNNLVT